MVTYQTGEATATIILPGGITTATDSVLEPWTYGLLEGKVLVDAIPVLNAAVEVVQVVASVKTVLGITFTNADGEYKVSVPVVASATYEINVYSPIA